eukprot:TRINITY_DN18880_c0_g2_i1.p1 TRINITY_DN18880_c0_g2~~TRINITY_DN18880_c0_g2_i1.p1  ORF type:complete len:1506 (-),score=262.70 TRINITY_DN18880_c0_g2_i1:1242-5207(-)
MGSPPAQGQQTPSQHEAGPGRLVRGSPGGASTSSLQALGGPYRWSSEWADAMRRIAECTPPLVVGFSKSPEDDNELHALHNPGSRRGNGNERAVGMQRQALAQALSGKVPITAMSSISGARATHLLSVVTLEILRATQTGGVLQARNEEKRDIATASSSTLQCCFSYMDFSAQPLQPSVLQCLISMANLVFNVAISKAGAAEALVSMDTTFPGEDAIICHACFLIRVNPQQTQVQELADALLRQLRSRHPQVLWSSQCLEALLLELAGKSDPRAEGSPSALGHFAAEQRLKEWLSYGLLLAPASMQGLLQEVLRNPSLPTGELVRLLAGLRLDPPTASAYSTSTIISSLPAASLAAAAAAGGDGGKGMTEVLAASIKSATVKSRYAGEVAGMMQAASLRNLDSKIEEDQLDEAEERKEAIDPAMVVKFVTLLQHYALPGQKLYRNFREAAVRSTALLLLGQGSWQVKDPRGYLQLLRLLCWSPLQLFTQQAMEVGVYVWTWLLAARPSLCVPVLAEVTDGWLWTIEEHRGIFANDARYSGPHEQLRPHLVAGEPQHDNSSSPTDSVVDQIAAHHVLLGFLLDQYQVARSRSTEILALIGRLLHGSLLDPAQLSTHPAAGSAVWSLLLLALEFAVDQLARTPPAGVQALRLLRDKVHRVALACFAVLPCWYDAGGQTEAECHVLECFLKHLGTEERTESGFGKDSASDLKGRHPVWGSTDGDTFSSRSKRRKLLQFLCGHELDRLYTWAQPLNETRTPYVKSNGMGAEQWSPLVEAAWAVDPRIAICLVRRFPASTALSSQVAALVQANARYLHHIPEALSLLVTPSSVESNSPLLQLLPYWAPCSITAAMAFLLPAYQSHPRVMGYVLRVLETYPPVSVLAFMPQMVQALRYDKKGLVEEYLMVAAQRSDLFAHNLIWQLQGEEALPADDGGVEESTAKAGEPNLLWEIVPRVRQRIIDGFSADARGTFEREFNFFDAVTTISGTLKPIPKDERRAAIRPELEKIKLEGDDIYLPTSPEQLVRGIILDSGRPLQSAAKVPIMIAFNVVEEGGDPRNIRPQACIFKVGDDCRQDVLALQVIALLRDINRAYGLKLYLFPYGVLPTGPERGIIEMVPNTRSRNEMGEITDGGMYEIFQQEYGPPGSPAFERARSNFIASSAGYAVASLVLQPKDRHNGNLLIDSVGHLVHIDFGFILETSPGGNMRFESADFKISHEMTQLLDPSGIMKSEPWDRFVSLCVKGYLAARQHSAAIITIVELMLDSGLPCFSRGDPIGNLRKRLHEEMSEREAANFMRATCTDAYNKWSTAGYDLIQYLQQGIEK